jgi:hypothetical protein
MRKPRDERKRVAASESRHELVTAQNMRVDATAHRGPHQKHTSQQSELRLFNANRL